MAKKKNPTPMQAIRAKCLDCAGGSHKEVRLCAVTDCDLWPFRMGKRPETLAKSRPELLDEKYVRLAGFIDAYRADHPRSDPWESAEVKSAQAGIFGKRPVNRDWIRKILKRRSLTSSKSVSGPVHGR